MKPKELWRYGSTTGQDLSVATTTDGGFEVVLETGAAQTRFCLTPIMALEMTKAILAVSALEFERVPPKVVRSPSAGDVDALKARVRELETWAVELVTALGSVPEVQCQVHLPPPHTPDTGES